MKQLYIAAGACALSVCLAGTLLVGASNFPNPQVDEKDPAAKRETAVLAGGCFWGVEAVYEHVKGVSKVVSGYAGGEKKTAKSDLVEAGGTGHAESVMITYDPSKITYGQILKIFFSVAHNPTEVNRQGPDVGTQYRSMIFYSNEEQHNIAKSYIAELESSHVLPRKIATELVALDGFYPAEEFMQHYSQMHPTDPYVLHNDDPKIDALKKDFAEVYKR